MAIGYAIKKIGLNGADMAKTINKLVFRIFLPAMLFLNIYNLDSISSVEFDYIPYAVIAIVHVFALFIFLVVIVIKRKDRSGVILHACFRSNYALIGIPLSQSILGQSGVSVAALLSVATIPLFNILAVINLSVFGSGEQKPDVKEILLGIVKNPLIQGILPGLLVPAIRFVFENHGIDFHLSQVTPIYTVLGYMSDLATSLALLMLGVQLEFSAAGKMKKEIISGTLMRTVIVPPSGTRFCIHFLL